MLICNRIIRNANKYTSGGNFVFVHLHRTAGKSIQKCLKTAGCIFEPEFYYRKNRKKKYRFKGKHTRPIDIISYIGREEWEKYFTFCFVRNPFCKLVSYFMHNKQKYNKITRTQRRYWKIFKKRKSFTYPNFKYIFEYKSFKAWIEDMENFKEFSDPYIKLILSSQLDFVSDENGKILVDYMGKLENLVDDFDIVCKKLNINNNLSKTHINKSKHGLYHKYYNKKMIKIVENIFKRDLEYFNYSF